MFNIELFIVTVDKLKKSEDDAGALTDGENGKFITCIKLFNRIKIIIFKIKVVKFLFFLIHFI